MLFISAFTEPYGLFKSVTNMTLNPCMFSESGGSCRLTVNTYCPAELQVIVGVPLKHAATPCPKPIDSGAKAAVGREGCVYCTAKTARNTMKAATLKLFK